MTHRQNIYEQVRGYPLLTTSSAVSRDHSSVFGLLVASNSKSVAIVQSVVSVFLIVMTGYGSCTVINP
jgi:hypothetical protein